MELNSVYIVWHGFASVEPLEGQVQLQFGLRSGLIWIDTLMSSFNDVMMSYL